MSSIFRAGVAALALSVLSLAVVPAAMAGSRPDDKSAEAEVKGVGPEATKAARRAAIAEWKREVARDGNTPVWRTATEKKVKCKTHRTETECEVEARPLR
ncbi:MAG: hypothetical protein K2Y42_01440 [Hyphomicrobium sp.]|jgi:hypothetical protein|uniref:hypothetical protein n=1 Tax=Hyphomicrobium sp. TaxID=82 RepID=UPI0025BACE1B|nr:hypothetical protein [Hyphomicrobium sp.]MBX9861390.1 hypothetical protein [Hyphomicrobium sp.]